MWQKLHREERSEDSGDDGHELDEDVEARARGVFEGVAYCVADYRGRVRRGSLAAEVAAFYVFFAVVPRAAGVGHEYGHHDSGDYGAAEESAERGGAERKSDDDGDEEMEDESEDGDEELDDETDTEEAEESPDPEDEDEGEPEHDTEPGGEESSADLLRTLFSEEDRPGHQR